MTVSWWTGTISKLGDFLLKHHSRETFATTRQGPPQPVYLDTRCWEFLLEDLGHGFTIVHTTCGPFQKGERLSNAFFWSKYLQCSQSGMPMRFQPSHFAWNLLYLPGSQTCIILSCNFGILTATVDFCFLAKHLVSALLAISA